MSQSTYVLDFIVQGLTSGFKVSDIALSLGYTDSAVLQLIDKHQLRDKAVKQQVSANSVFSEIDNKLNDIELRLAKRASIAIGEIQDPMKVLLALKTVNSLKRRGATENVKKVGNDDTITITLPAHVASKLVETLPAFRYNAKNEAIAIGDRNLITASQTSLKQLAEVHNGKQKLQVEESASFLRESAAKLGNNQETLEQDEVSEAFR